MHYSDFVFIDLDSALALLLFWADQIDRLIAVAL